MIWGPNTEAESRMFIQDCIEWKHTTPRLHYDFAITLKESGKVIGGCGIYMNEAQNEGMVGWILHRDYWKKGYMPEAAMCFLYLLSKKASSAISINPKDNAKTFVRQSNYIFYLI